MSKKIFVGNCSFSVNDDSLKAFIEAQGVQVAEVKIIYDRNSGRSRGFGFAELADSQDIQAAIDALNGKELEGRAITVNEAREQSPRTGGGSGRGPGGFRSSGGGSGGGRPNRFGGSGGGRGGEGGGGRRFNNR